MLAPITSPTGKPAASAVSFGAPCMTKSLDRAIPCPNKFIATATPIAGKPTFKATGSITAPTRATAGEGQKNQDITIITIPITQ